MCRQNEYNPTGRPHFKNKILSAAKKKVCNDGQWSKPNVVSHSSAIKPTRHHQIEYKNNSPWLFMCTYKSYTNKCGFSLVHLLNAPHSHYTYYCLHENNNSNGRANEKPRKCPPFKQIRKVCKKSILALQYITPAYTHQHSNTLHRAPDEKPK